jgi:hypothetical protein
VTVDGIEIARSRHPERLWALTRLTNISSDLVERLRRATTPELRAIALLAATMAADQASPTHPIFEKALQELTGMHGLQERTAEELKRTEQEADEKYFSLQQDAEVTGGDDAEWMKSFRNARVAAALYWAGDLDPFQAATESVYEAIAAVGDSEAIMLKIAGVLHD